MRSAATSALRSREGLAQWQNKQLGNYRLFGKTIGSAISRHLILQSLLSFACTSMPFSTAN
jgi:hypothetical protein